ARNLLVGAPTRCFENSSSESLFSNCLQVFRNNLREIGDGGKLTKEITQKRQTIPADLFVFGHHHHVVEKLVDRRTKPGDFLERLAIPARPLVSARGCPHFS